MPFALRYIFILLALCIATLNSCRTEEEELIQAPEESLLTPNSKVASLMLKTTSNDGSIDNIIDKSNCFYVKHPFQVTANGEDLTINTVEDYKIVEYIFDDDDDDIDNLTIKYPINIVLNDFTEVVVNSATQLNSYSKNCNGENEADDDIECVDFGYPITASVFNTNSDLISTETFTSDPDLFGFIKTINTDHFVSINFPITVILTDNTEITINSLQELETTIEIHKNDCDEDDDYDYNDDDCDDCNIEALIDRLTSCSNWNVDKLERYGNDYDNAYNGYTFNFYNNGNVSVYWSGTSAYGTYTANGTGNNITVTINIPELPYCNNDWVLHEISEYTKTKVDLRVGGDDRLRYENNCN
ncbi:hypothetical protein [Aestuariivivens insulae]|uniref:hypothetical protein n=1 Tax=Aestuariivivens insulae TaxID=1621988 RepID=UPI001F597ED4|nr:hypothetical protein [Aestuariivivens insulae]